MPGVSDLVIWLALAGGTAAAAAALYGHYYVLPGWLTGPEICRLEDGGCAVLFRSPRSALLGVPNATLGLALYALLALGLLLEAPSWLLLADDGTSRRDERLPRPEPDRQWSSVPHLLDRPRVECVAVRDVARSDCQLGSVTAALDPNRRRPIGANHPLNHNRARRIGNNPGRADSRFSGGAVQRAQLG